MDLLHLVDRLEEQVAGAQKMPIGNRAIVDRRRMLDIIDQMRIAVPREVRDAQDIVARQDSVMREAEEEARMVIARAEEQAARLVEEHELTVAARRRAEEIAVQAEARLEERIREANQDISERLEESRHLAQQQMRAADDYARELLNRLNRQLQAFVRSVQSGIDQLEDEPAAPADYVAAYEDDATALLEPEPERRITPREPLAEMVFPERDGDEGGDDADDGAEWGREPDDDAAEPVAASVYARGAADLDDSDDGTARVLGSAYEPPGARLPDREPLPIRRERSVEASSAAGRGTDGPDLENLLRRTTTTDPTSEEAAPVIDDFDRPALDDDPTVEKGS